MGSRKGKRRNSEKRKEKSRDAARCRRNKEGEVFSALAGQLPLEPSLTLQQDKASIMRLAISHLKLRKLLGKENSPKDYVNSLQKKLDTQYCKTLNGFVLVLDKEGDLVYLSDNVSKYLGLTQLELIGHSLFDYTHPCDHDDIREMLSEKPAHTPTDKQASDRRHFMMRMKCTLTSKGRNVNLKSATYKTISCSGRYVTSDSGSNFRGVLDDKSLSCLLLIGEPIPHPSNIEVPLDSQTFVSRHSMDMKFSYCDEKISDLLGYESKDLVGQSLYDFHHALDTNNIKESYKNLFSKGQALIGCYRFLAQGGGYCWTHTEATVVTNQRTERPQCVVCINYILSRVQEPDLVMSNVQVDLPPQRIELKPEPNEPTVQPSGMIFSTSSIFAPRPPDADSDMLRITDCNGKESILMDLDQLAPACGDITMPLSNFPESDVKLEYLQNQQKGSTLDVFAPKSADLSSTTCNTTDMAVLDLSFLRNNMKNDGNLNKSASLNKDPSNTEPQTMLTQNLIDDDDIDFDLRAPFIPMDGEEDRIFDEDWVPLLDSQMEYKEMLGTTESVFGPDPSFMEDSTTNNNKNTPLSILRLQAASKQTSASVGDIARHAGPPKMKRPMETNRLETGPPYEKQPRVETVTKLSSPSTASNVSHTSIEVNPDMSFPDIASFFKDNDEIKKNQTPPSKESVLNEMPKKSVLNDTPPTKESVLKNLLTRGEDVNFGYKIKTTLKPPDMHRAQTLHSLLTSDLSTDEYDDSSSDDDIIMVPSPPPLSAQITEDGAGPAGTRPGIRETISGQPNMMVIRTSNGILMAPINNRDKVIPIMYM